MTHASTGKIYFFDKSVSFIYDSKKDRACYEGTVFIDWFGCLKFQVRMFKFPVGFF